MYAPVGRIKAAQCGKRLEKKSEKLVDAEQGGVLAEVKFGARYPEIVKISKRCTVDNVCTHCAHKKVSDSDTKVLSEDFGDVIVVL